MAVSSDDVLWQPEAAIVPAEVTEAEYSYQQQPNNLESAAKLVEAYLEVIRRSDSHELLQKARSIQTDVFEHPNSSTHIPWLIASADLYQYQHEFEAAQKSLAAVIAREPRHLRGSLMLARIKLAQGNIDQARSICANLFGHHELGIVSTCLLEVEGREENPQPVYNKLKQLHQRNDAQSSMVVRQWRLQILAEQAILLGHYEEAQHWLSELPEPKTIVEQKLLLDSFLFAPSLSVPRALIADCSETVVDAIAVRLARAQQTIGGGCWVDYAKQRIQLREIRNDKLHSADIAYYFTYVEPKPEAALHWAEINYSVAKEPFDRKLLEHAQALVSKQSNTGVE
ncbi:tetratricopeptide repeat protein [Idiomarina sp. A28L]|uniref:tetratricopeptide repeat protein n=1 Tax=Idiomarina sp. A28L TaxID=1036674 RepID=UPI001112A798|nr:tetratricopeptide repeat protein [Idiomarina sp. A28L]